MRSKIAANLNVLEFVKIFGDICKTLGVRWSNRYGVTAPLQWCIERAHVIFFWCPVPKIKQYKQLVGISNKIVF